MPKPICLPARSALLFCRFAIIIFFLVFGFLSQLQISTHDKSFA